jgi:predicted HAD superfamily hydrolase
MIAKRYVFIDFFDTIVHRAIPPEEVKKLWARILAVDLKLEVDIYELRFKSEAQLCADNFIKHQENEFRYNDMCALLWNELKNFTDLEFESFLLICRSLEIRIEKQIQYLNNDNVKFLIDSKNKGKKIYLISDFYFDRILFEKVIQFHNLSDLFDDIFISSEYIASKRSGRLYQKAQEILNLTSFDNSRMIGDNQIADVANAKQSGLNVHWSDASVNHKYYNTTSANENLVSLIGKFNNVYNVEQRLIYPELALSLHLFIVKLVSELKIAGAKDVLFMAREGEFLKKLFDQYVSFTGDGIRSHYFYVSRRSTFLPSLSSLDQEDFHVLFRQYINISPLEFLLNLNFEDIQIRELQNVIDYDFAARVDDFPASIEFQQLKCCSLFGEFYESNRLQQLQNFNHYFSSFNLDYNELFIVDVGWKGSIQDNLANIFKTLKINGYYLGLNIATGETTKSTKKGLLFDPLTAFDISCSSSIYNECTSLYEVILGASHGSTRKYLPDGRAELLENEIESNLFHNTILPIQQEMLNYIRLVSGIFAWSNKTSNEIENFIVREYTNFIFSPSAKQLELFSSIYHVESFGVHETTKFISGGASFFSSLKKFIRAPKEYINTAFWLAQKLAIDKLGFLIPIYKFYRMRKIAK